MIVEIWQIKLALNNILSARYREVSFWVCLKPEIRNPESIINRYILVPQQQLLSEEQNKMAQLNAQNRPLSLRNGLMHITLLLGMGFVHQKYDLRKRIELGWEIGLVLSFIFPGEATPGNSWQGWTTPGSTSPDPTLDQKIVIFHTRFQTWPQKSIPVFGPGGGHKTQQYMFTSTEIM